MASATGYPDNVPEFVQKLWEMLQDDSWNEIIKWNKDGTGFLLCDKKTDSDQKKDRKGIEENFVSSGILKKYFEHNSLASFKKQLSNYFFHINQDTKAYHHDDGYFNRNHPELLKNIKHRKKVTQNTTTSNATGVAMPMDVTDLNMLPKDVNVQEPQMEINGALQEVQGEGASDWLMDADYHFDDQQSACQDPLWCSAIYNLEPLASNDTIQQQNELHQMTAWPTSLSDVSSEGNLSLQEERLDDVKIDPDRGPSKDRNRFSLIISSNIFHSAEDLLVDFVGKEKTVADVKVVKYERNEWLGKTPAWGKEETVTAIIKIKTPNRNSHNADVLAQRNYTFFDEEVDEYQAFLQSMRLQYALCDEMAKHQPEINERRGIIAASSDTFGFSEQGRQLQLVDLLQRVVYTAARIGVSTQFIKALFSTSTGLIVFQTYKNRNPLPEDIADANRHDEIAAFFRGITERFSKEDERSQMQTTDINWHELARAIEKTELSGSSDAGYTTGFVYSGDTEISSSEVEVQLCSGFKDSVSKEDEDQLEPKVSLDNKFCDAASCGPLPELRRLTLEDDQDEDVMCIHQLCNNDEREDDVSRPVNCGEAVKTSSDVEVQHKIELNQGLDEGHFFEIPPSLPDNIEQVEFLVTEPSWLGQEKTPVHNDCEYSVQLPSPGMTIRLFLFEITSSQRNVKTFNLFIIPEEEEECEVYENICRDFMAEAAIHHGSSRQIPFTVDNSRSQDFHTVFMQNLVSAAFEIENRFQDNVVALNERNDEHVFQVSSIRAASQSRVAKGSNWLFFVQNVGENRKQRQEQGKVTLTIDSTDQRTLLFPIFI